MKEEAKKAVKRYTRGELMRTRWELGVSREEMGFRMGMTAWGYKDLERGISCCSLISMLLFVNYCCKDPEAFLKGLKEAAHSDDWDEVFKGRA